MKKLYKDFPKIFDSLRDGFECNDGWYHLIYMLSAHIQYYINQNKKCQVEATQVKEKFGGLRFYVAFDITFTKNLIDKINILIKEAETKSQTICEISGSPGILYVKNKWRKTLCKQEADKLEYEKK